MTQEIPAAVFWCLLAVALALVVLLLRARRVSTRLRDRIRVLDDDVRTRDAEVRHLATVRLAARAESAGRRKVPVPGMLHERLAGSDFAASLHGVMDLFARADEGARGRADTAAKTAL